jgi:hypothetical protein
LPITVHPIRPIIDGQSGYLSKLSAYFSIAQAKASFALLVARRSAGENRGHAERQPIACPTRLDAYSRERD